MEALSKPLSKQLPKLPWWKCATREIFYSSGLNTGLQNPWFESSEAFLLHLSHSDFLLRLDRCYFLMKEWNAEECQSICLFFLPIQTEKYPQSIQGLNDIFSRSLRCQVCLKWLELSSDFSCVTKTISASPCLCCCKRLSTTTFSKHVDIITAST